jgi:DNA-binding transcriptional regulator GbsR (MarR family)
VSEGVLDFQNRVAGMLAAAGFPRMPARVMMALMVSEDGLTAAEIARGLASSAAAVSGAVRYLQLLGFVARIPVSGSRRDRYAIVKSWYAMTMTNVVVYEQVSSAAAEGAATLPEGSAARARVLEMSDFFAFVQNRLVELMREWEERAGQSSASRRAR